MSQKDYCDVYTHVLQDQKHHRAIESNITHSQWPLGLLEHCRIRYMTMTYFKVINDISLFMTIRVIAQIICLILSV